MRVGPFGTRDEAAKAQADGRFAEEIVPVTVPAGRRETKLVEVDEHPRETSLEKLAALPTPFREGGTVTAGNASGINDGITATKTYMLCVNRNEWALGQRTALDVETDDSIYRESYQPVAVAFMREDFQSLASAATNEDTAIAYNVTP